jgi:hypothetical protein
LAQWSEFASVTATQEAVAYDLPAPGPPVLFLRVLAP